MKDHKLNLKFAPMYLAGIKIDEEYDCYHRFSKILCASRKFWFSIIMIYMNIGAKNLATLFKWK